MCDAYINIYTVVWTNWKAIIGPWKQITFYRIGLLHSTHDNTIPLVLHLYYQHRYNFHFVKLGGLLKVAVNTNKQQIFIALCIQIIVSTDMFMCVYRQHTILGLGGLLGKQ